MNATDYSSRRRNAVLVKGEAIDSNNAEACVCLEVWLVVVVPRHPINLHGAQRLASNARHNLFRWAPEKAICTTFRPTNPRWPELLLAALRAPHSHLTQITICTHALVFPLVLRIAALFFPFCTQLPSWTALQPTATDRPTRPLSFTNYPKRKAGPRLGRTKPRGNARDGRSSSSFARPTR
jgi:hypothetical protein